MHYAHSQVCETHECSGDRRRRASSWPVQTGRRKPTRSIRVRTPTPRGVGSLPPSPREKVRRPVARRQAVQRCSALRHDVRKARGRFCRAFWRFSSDRNERGALQLAETGRPTRSRGSQWRPPAEIAHLHRPVGVSAATTARARRPTTPLRFIKHAAVGSPAVRVAVAPVDIWLILPVVICLSQRLSHACLSTDFDIVKPRMAH